MKIDQALQNGGETAVCSGGEGVLVKNDHNSLVVTSFEKIFESRLVVGKDSSLGFAQTKLDGTAQIPNLDFSSPGYSKGVQSQHGPLG